MGSKHCVGVCEGQFEKTGVCRLLGTVFHKVATFIYYSFLYYLKRSIALIFATVIKTNRFFQPAAAGTHTGKGVGLYSQTCHEADVTYRPVECMF
jgi:hypothetical protein